MANFMPVLAGRPDFGSKDRNSWLEVLMLFLGDPFRPVGGRYNWQVPPDAITGGVSATTTNSYGVPTLSFTVTSHLVEIDGTMAVTNQPGVLYVSHRPDGISNTVGLAMYLLYEPDGVFLLTSASVGYGIWGDTFDDVDKHNVYSEAGGPAWFLQNKTAWAQYYSFFHVALGAART